MKLKRILSLLIVMAMVLSSMGTVAFASGNVAKVGNTEYATIDEAIANWTNNTTLTLLANVTLSDVVTLKSTEHHILNLGTYTMTAASGKNAFVIQACGTGSAESSAITINADATNPGGINAGSKCVVYYKYADGGISTEDRPIIKINGGIFTGSTSSWGTAGIYTIGTAARKCATVNVSGGTFNCSIVGSGKSKLIVSGGTFNYTVSSQGDSTCSRLISGGTFKTLGFMTADSNNTKFWIGTSMGNSNVGVHVDDNGYIVIGGPVVTEAGETFEASSANYSGASSYLQYSSAQTNGLYYTSVEEALADNNKSTGSVTVYVDELDMTNISYKGTIVVPEGEEIKIIVTEGTTPAFTVDAGEGAVVKYEDADGNELVEGANGSFEVKPATVEGVSVDGVKVNAYINEGVENSYNITLVNSDDWKEGSTATITLPAVDGAVNGDNAYVVHEHNGVNYIYVGKVADGKITFTNNVGFSTFTVYAGGLQEALDTVKKDTTIYLEADTEYDTIYIGRPTKSNDTTMYCGSCSYTTEDAEEFKTHLNDGKWHTTPDYTTNLENVTIVGAEGSTIAGVVITSGHAYGDVYDYVRGIDYDSGSAYYSTLNITNLTFEGISFVGKVNINTSDADSVYDGVKFNNCTFTTGGTGSTNGAAIRYYNESNNGNVKNITINDCTFNNCYQGVYTQNISGVTVTDSTFNTIGHNAIALQSGTEPVNHGNVTISGNTFENITDRVIRFNNVAEGSVVSIKNNIATNSGDENGEFIKATSLADSVEITREENTWNGYADSKLVFENGILTTPTYVAKIGETEYTTLEEAFTNAQDGETITLLSNATPTLTSQRAITKASVIDLGGNTLTLTEDDLYFGTTTFKNGTIVVDENVKPSTAVFWMFANQTLTFDKVKLIATGVTGTYLIGLDGNNSDLNLINGSEIVVENETALDLDIICVNASTGNDILVKNSKVTVKNLDGRVFFRGNYTVSGNSEVNLDGITKAGFRIEAGQTLTISDTANVTITGEPRDGGIHLTDVTAVYTKADTATVTATVNKPALPVAKIGDTEYTTLEEALNAASSMTGDVTVEILDKVTLNKNLSGNYDSITFVGTTDTAEIYLDVQGYITATGKNVAFTDLTLSKSEGGYITNAGFMNVAFGIYDVLKVTYTNCTFTNGAYASSGVNTFTKCTFYRSYDKYGLWAYGDAEVIVDNCVFADYRGIKMYAEGAARTVDLTVKNTDFSALSGKPAIVLTYGESVTLEGNTYSSTGVFELDLDGDPNGTPVTSDVSPVCVNDNGACGVLVDGMIYTTVSDAVAAAEEGDEVTLLYSTDETATFEEGVILTLAEGVVADNVTVKVPVVYVAKIGETEYTSVAEALAAAQADGLTDVTITLIGETSADTEDTFNLAYGTAFDNVTFNQEDNTKPYYIAGIYTGDRTASDGKFIFDGVNIISTSNIWFECDVVLKNNSVLTRPDDSKNFVYYGTLTIEPGSQFISQIDDVMAGTLIVDGGKTDGTFNDTYNYRSIYVDVREGQTLTIKNGANVRFNAANEIGRLTLNGNAIVTDSKLDVFNNIAMGANSNLNLDTESIIAAKVITGAGVITIDAADFTGETVQVINADMSGFTGTVEIINNTKAQYEITDTGIVVSAKAEPVAKIGETEYTSLADAAVAAVSGNTITMIADAAEDVTLPAGIIFDGNDKQVGAITAAGEITFKGHTKATNFSVKYTNTTINIGEGACLELTGTGRLVIGHGCTFNIKGLVADAKTADTANITPSLIAAGASLTGAGVNFNVTNAYVKFTAYCSSKNSNASGTYNINVTNSIWEQTGSLVFSEPTNGMDPTFNFNVKDSVLNSTSHLVFAVTKGEIVFDNSNVNVGTSRQIENRSTLTIKNGSVVNGAVATSSNAKNPGTLIIENATYSVTGEFTGSDVGTGTIVIMDGANFTADKITKANIQIDAANMSAGDEINLTADLSGLTGAVEVINNDKLVANIVDNKIVLSAKAEPVAKVGDTEYTSLQAAINNANGATVTLIANTAETISIDDNATVVIDLGGNILTGYIAPCDPVSLTVKNGSIVNTNGNYSAIEINSGKLTLENTNIESARHGVRIDGAVEAIINGGEYKLNATSGTRHAVNVSGGATLTIKDGTFIGPKGTTMDSGSAVCVQSGATVIIEDGNFSGGKNATLGVSGTMTIYGGTFDQNPSEYLADGYIARGANGEITTDEYIVCVEDFDIKVLMLWDFDKVQAPDADGTMVDCYPVALFGIINTLNYKEVGFILEFEDPDTKEIKTHNFVTNDAYTSLLVNEDVKNQIGASSTTVTPDMYDGTYFYGDMMNMKAKYADSPLRFRPYAKLLDGTYVYGKARYNIDEITDKDDK